MSCRLRLVLVVSCAGLPRAASASIDSPVIFCEVYPQSPHCSSVAVTCRLCHGAPPELNEYGVDIASALTTPDVAGGLSMALIARESLDSDADGSNNAIEINDGTFPGDAASLAVTTPGTVWDSLRAYRRLHIDFCGQPASFDDVEAFISMEAEDRLEAIDEALDECMKSEHWRGKDGVLWSLAHPKIRPIGALKAGEDPGEAQVVDYYDDYNLFVWSQIDDQDVRELLTTTAFIDRSEPPTRYQVVSEKSSQMTPVERRAGMLTTRWFVFNFIMFEPIPRAAAAHAYRAYLGLDLGSYEGLAGVMGEPVDRDRKGVAAPACALCHATIDPLAYPFSRYDGFATVPYQMDRLQRLTDEFPGIEQTPESGVVLGRPVADLREWARMAADSDAFARATVMDYWRLLVGYPPEGPSAAVFEHLWRDLRSRHQYRVSGMLHELVRTKAYAGG